MTTKERIKRIVDTIDDVVIVATTDATNQLFADIEDRIFNKGLDADNKPIGRYSTKGIFVGGSSFRNKSTADAFFSKIKQLEKKRKDGSNWRTIDNHHLYFLEGGYKHLRELQGLQSAKVDLTVTGHLKSSITRDDNRVFFENIYGVKVGRGQEVHFKKDIFQPTKEEKKTVLKIMNEHIDKLFTNG